jgi:hypothetical protein
MQPTISRKDAANVAVVFPPAFGLQQNCAPRAQMLVSALASTAQGCESTFNIHQPAANSIVFVIHRRIVNVIFGCCSRPTDSHSMSSISSWVLASWLVRRLAVVAQQHEI